MERFLRLSHVEKVSLSFGDPRMSEDIDELRFMVEETDSVLQGNSKSCISVSSTERQVSTIASRQLTNSSALSRFDSGFFEKGPAKRQRPPKPNAI